MKSFLGNISRGQRTESEAWYGDKLEDSYK